MVVSIGSGLNSSNSLYLPTECGTNVRHSFQLDKIHKKYEEYSTGLYRTFVRFCPGFLCKVHNK